MSTRWVDGINRLKKRFYHIISDHPFSPNQYRFFSFHFSFATDSLEGFVEKSRLQRIKKYSLPNWLTRSAESIELPESFRISDLCNPNLSLCNCLPNICDTPAAICATPSICTPAICATPGICAPAICATPGICAPPVCPTPCAPIPNCGTRSRFRRNFLRPYRRQSLSLQFC